MLKRKLMKTSNENELGKGKEFVKKRKKAICAVGLGVLLLTGIGFGLSSLVNRETTNAKVSLENSVDEIPNTYEDTENGEEATTKESSTEPVEDAKVAKDGETASATKESTEVAKDGEIASIAKESTLSTETSKDGETASATKESTSSTEKSSATIAKQTTSKSTSRAESTKQTSTPTVTPTKETPSHSHSWSPVTSVVNHEASGHWEDVVVKAAWSEEIPKYETKEREICHACDADITGTNITAHAKKHTLAGENGGFRSIWKKVQVGTKTVNHPAVYDKKWVVDKQAWSETVTNGHKCSCGSTK